MTVAEWISGQAPPPPDVLLARVLALVGRNGEGPAEATPQVCLTAAASHLASIIGQQRYGRESALDLLAVDALVTYAFEYASAANGIELDPLSRDAIAQIGALTPAHE